MLVAAIGGGAIASGCGSNSTVATGPTPLKCQVALATQTSSIGADGGTGSLTVTASPECPWDVSTGASWLSGLSPASGQGAGTVEFRVAANPLPSVREGDIVVNENRLRLSQQAAACRLTLQTASLTLDGGGGTREVAVSSTSGCAWTAATDASWIAFTTPVTGNGDGTLGVSIAPNPGDARRVGAIAVGDQRLTITQEPEASVPPAPGCVFSITSTSQAILPSAGGEVSASVSVASGCMWTAGSSVAWIAVVTGAAGTGSGPVTFSVSPNPGSVRAGTVIVAGQTFTITQAAATSSCTYSIGPPSASLAAAGGSGTVSVSAADGCSWTATSTAAWITVISGASGVGSGPVAFSVAANSGAVRTGTMGIAGQTFTVTQAAATPAPCSFAVAPLDASFAAAGGSGTITVTAGAGCTWAAGRNADWITVTSGATGSGSAAVTFNVAPNPGAARSGTLSVAGHTVTVNQAAAPAPCTYSLAPSTASFGVLGGTGTFTVTTGGGCNWTAESTANWVVVTSGAGGTGNGGVRFSVLANLGGTRTGTITVEGRTFTVTQAALISLPLTRSTVRQH